MFKTPGRAAGRKEQPRRRWLRLGTDSEKHYPLRELRSCLAALNPHRRLSSLAFIDPVYRIVGHIGDNEVTSCCLRRNPLCGYDFKNDSVANDKDTVKRNLDSLAHIQRVEELFDPFKVFANIVTALVNISDGYTKIVRLLYHTCFIKIFQELIVGNRPASFNFYDGFVRGIVGIDIE